MFYHTPYWLRLLGGKGLHWEIPGAGNDLYLSFDDGPDPDTTPIILDILDRYKVKATFFCVGENVERYPEIFAGIKGKGHAVGNHTYNHLKGWETSTKTYLENVEKCSRVVESKLFRPPYGKMKHSQRRVLKDNYKIIMWSVLSRDYDARVRKETCLKKSLKYTKPGAIIVFHDHKKSIEKVKWVLPKYLKQTLEKGNRYEILQF